MVLDLTVIAGLSITLIDNLSFLPLGRLLYLFFVSLFLEFLEVYRLLLQDTSRSSKTQEIHFAQDDVVSLTKVNSQR